MAYVVRFVLNSAYDLVIPGVGWFVNGVLDVDANEIDRVLRARYLVQPYRAVEVGIVDSETPPPVLPAEPIEPIPDPYPQYLSDDELATLESRIDRTGAADGMVPVLQADLETLAFEAVGVTDHGALTGLADDDHPISAITGLQSALDGKQAAGTYATAADISTASTADRARANHTGTQPASTISDSTTVGRSVLTAVDAAAARTAIGAGTSNLALGTTSTTAKVGDYTPIKAELGLDQVDNTRDADKPVSTATQIELNRRVRGFSVSAMRALVPADYTALETKSPNTLYLIVETAPAPLPDPDNPPAEPAPPPDMTPLNAVTSANAARQITVTADPVTGAVEYRFYERQTTGGPLPGGPFLTPSRTSPEVAVGTYWYRIVAVDADGVEHTSPEMQILADGVPRTVSANYNPVTEEPPPPTGGETPVPSEQLATAWRTAKDTKDSATIKAFFDTNVKVNGRITFAGTHAGGTVTTQAGADALEGKTVTGDITLDGTFTVRNCRFLGRRVSCYGGGVVLENCLIDGADQTFSPDHFRIYGKATLFRCEIRKAQDGLKTFSGSHVTYSYVMIHEPSQAVGGLTGNQTHQDAIQVMGGDFLGSAVYIDYEYNHGGGQGILVKADSGDIGTFQFKDSFLKAGGNMLTFEATSRGYPNVIDLGTGDQRVVVAPAANMNNVLSMYVNAPVTMPQSMQNQILGHTFFVANKGGTTLQWKNGIAKAAIS